LTGFLQKPPGNSDPNLLADSNLARTFIYIYFPFHAEQSQRAMDELNQPRNGICKLCRQDAVLQLSHIQPKFVFRWMKQTGDGYLRSGGNFNQRRQDGDKEYMLCTSCEKNFGKLETYFSSKIFLPFVIGTVDQFTYDERLFKFVVSVLWRYFHFEFLESEKDTFSYPFMLSAEAEWRAYLLNNIQPKQFTSLHLLPSNPRFEDAEQLADNHLARLVRYLARNVDAVVTDNCQDYSIGFIKLPKFAFIIPLAGFDHSLMRDTHIDPKGGTYHANQAISADPLIGELLMDRVRQIESGLDGMSSTQKQKIADEKERKWPVLKDKDLGQVMRFAAQFIDKNH
jgi:hypothetical protein